jgi:hypothetical protein
VKEDAMRRLLIVPCVSLGLVALALFGSDPTPLQAAGHSPTGQAAAGAKQNPLVGTWKLLAIERRDANGPLPPARPPAFGSPNPVGLMIYDPDGYMAVAMMQSGRQKYVSNEPTPAEAKATIESHISYFGTYTINEAERVVTYHIQGSLDPRWTGTDQKSAFEVSGNRITLKPPRAANGEQYAVTW